MKFLITKKESNSKSKIESLEPSIDFIKRVNRLKEYLFKRQQGISQKLTPQEQIKKRPDGFDYVEEGYMREKLNKEFPGWSWVEAGTNPVLFIGAEWVIVSGKLTIPDFGIVLPNQEIFVREFLSPGAARIQFKRDQPHTPENVIDIDKNLAAANTNGFKRAINRLCNIADDVYKKEMTVKASKETIDKLNKLIIKLDHTNRNYINNFISKYGGIEEMSEERVLKIIQNIGE